jgi:hypothetical protein
MFGGVPLLFGKDSMNANKPVVIESNQNDPSQAEADYQRYIKDKAGDLKVEYDKFDNQTIIKTNFGRGWANRNELEFFKHKGEDGFDLAWVELKVQASIPDDKETPEKYTLIFSSFVQRPVFVNQNYWKPQVTDFHYTDCNDFHWLVDSKPLRYLNEKYANHLGNDETDSVETFTVTLNEKQFETLANASAVECKICDTTFVFNKKHFWALRWVMEKAEEVRSGMVTPTAN